MATADKETTNGFATSTVVLCGLALVVFIYAASLFIQGGFNAAMGREYAAKVYGPGVSADLAALEAEQREILAGPVRWVDQERGVVAMPIEQAMTRILEQSQVEENRGE